MMKSLVRPPRLRMGDCIGVFTPSSPMHQGPFLEKFQHGVAMLEKAGFTVKLGKVTQSGATQGYRSASPRDRADEIMDLFVDPGVHALMSTIGGYNTSSVVELLDYDVIRAHPKVVCGYSDVTSLHCALMTRAGLSSFYGPAVFPSFGEWPEAPHETLDSFLDAVLRPWSGPREVVRPARWSRHFRNATNGDWKNTVRQWKSESGWNVLRPGTVEAPLFALNLNTLLTHAGTDTFPDFSDAMLLIEDMDAPLGRTERSLVHLARLGVFDKIKALLWGRVETPDASFASSIGVSGAASGADETAAYHALLSEFVPSHIPLVTEVDVSHTTPILTLAQGALARLHAPAGGVASLTLLEPMVSG